MPSQHEFPQYRKLQDRSYYKIVSYEEMFELQRLGKRWFVLHLVAHNFLDRTLVQDLLESDKGRYIAISEEEYRTIERYANIQ